MTAAAPAQEPPRIDHEAHGLKRILKIAWMAVALGLLKIGRAS